MKHDASGNARQKPENALDAFHPLIKAWFLERLGPPTSVQVRAWPVIQNREHVLVIGPTGGGKTLAAFLWGLQQLITGTWPTGRVNLVYVSPLKALNNDVRQNLLTPLAELRERFQTVGRSFPTIGIQTRSGDTPPADRRRMRKHPPEILIVTPESLNLMISSKSGRGLLDGVGTVILDEIHAVAGTKRGTHLITAVERLVLLSGEFQRIALSATVRPARVVADFIGGYRLDASGYIKRPVTVIQAQDTKAYEIQVRFPPDARERLENGSWWPALIAAFKTVISDNRATLLFANSRRMAEKICRLINADEPAPLAYAHHGSLSREIRLQVEQALKRGELRAIVATNSLELGIDIGELDQVILVQTPRAIASAIQRTGRAGHGVGRISRGVLFPTHGFDILEAAVMAKTLTDQDIEPIRPPAAPLDVLAQIVLAMTGVEAWDVDHLFAFLKTASPYHELSRRRFDLVLEMLAGRYAGTRMRELKPRVAIDRIDNRIEAREGALTLVWLGGGTIADRGYFNLRLKDSGARIGELDEEFVWERRIGDRFAMGTQIWKILRITPNDVEVSSAADAKGMIPFWKGELAQREFHLSEKIGMFLADADHLLETDAAGLGPQLETVYHLDSAAAAELESFLTRQRERTGACLPHRRHLLIEHFADPQNRHDGKQVILHTLWGGRVNRPLALALAAAWEARFGYPLEVYCDDNAVLLLLPHDFNPRDVLGGVTPENLDELLRQGLEKSGFFGARFRENAGRALLLPKIGPRKRMPLWMNRLRAKKLLAAVMPLPDFPILLETWRTCLQDDFDLQNTRRLLDELAIGHIRVSQCTTPAPSPFAAGLIWRQTNFHMYADDTPQSAAKSALDADLLREVALDGGLRPKLADALIAHLEARLQRIAPGYAPAPGAELVEWVKERLLIPEPEWQALSAAVRRDHGLAPEAGLHDSDAKLGWLMVPAAANPAVLALENLPQILWMLNLSAEQVRLRQMDDTAMSTPCAGRTEADNMPEPAGLLAQWLAYYGPLSRNRIQACLGAAPGWLTAHLETLIRAEQVVQDRFRQSGENVEICDRQNLETLLRLARQARRPSFEPLEKEALPLFLAAFQGLAAPNDGPEALEDALDRLLGLVLPAAAWEEYVFPTRLQPYYPAWLDSLMQTSDLIWMGRGDQKIAFALTDELALLHESGEGAEAPGFPMPQKAGRYSIAEVAADAGLDTATAIRMLWDQAWQGQITNDTFEVVRKGILNRFEAPFQGGRGPSGRHGRFGRWRSSRPLPGSWYALWRPESPEIRGHALAEQELAKNRVRLLLRRYGVLFRELLAREMDVLGWRRLMGTLRLMELSGEILAGHFFKGIDGLQFASHEALRYLQHPLPQDAIFWMNATDPASLCGIGPGELKSGLPARMATTWLVFHGTRLVLTAFQNGRRLEIETLPDHPGLPRYLEFFKILLSRAFNPLNSICVEVINGEPATKSPFKPALLQFGFIPDYKGLELRWTPY